VDYRSGTLEECMIPLVSSPYLLSLSFRLINAYFSRSFFQPDEYWQSLEPAHLWVFGYGWKTWEWRTRSPGGEEWSWQVWREMLKDGGKGGIRSPLSVLPTALVYEILRMAGLDDRGDWLVSSKLFLLRQRGRGSFADRTRNVIRYSHRACYKHL